MPLALARAAVAAALLVAATVVPVTAPGAVAAQEHDGAYYWGEQEQRDAEAGLLHPREWEQAIWEQGLEPVGAPEVWPPPAPFTLLPNPAWTRPGNGGAGSAAGAGGIMQLIADTAARYGLNPSAMVNIARCESGFNPGARGPFGERGIFQFMPGTWVATGQRMGRSTDFGLAFDATENIERAMWLARADGLRHWVCARRLGYIR